MKVEPPRTHWSTRAQYKQSRRNTCGQCSPVGKYIHTIAQFWLAEEVMVVVTGVTRQEHALDTFEVAVPLRHRIKSQLCFLQQMSSMARPDICWQSTGGEWSNSTLAISHRDYSVNFGIAISTAVSINFVYTHDPEHIGIPHTIAKPSQDRRRWNISICRAEFGCRDTVRNQCF